MTRCKQEGPLEGAFLLAHPCCTFTPASRCNIAPALTETPAKRVFTSRLSSLRMNLKVSDAVLPKVAVASTISSAVSCLSMRPVASRKDESLARSRKRSKDGLRLAARRSSGSNGHDPTRCSLDCNGLWLKALLAKVVWRFEEACSLPKRR